jgi:hypothetical protein
MSKFTRFTAEQQLVKDPYASKLLGKDYRRVVEGFRYYIGSEGSNKFVDVPACFLTDGASVPVFLRWLIRPFGKYAQACTLHDYLCENFEITVVTNGIPKQVRINRAEVDRILYESMRVLEINAISRNLIQVGVDGYRFVMNPKKPFVEPKKTALENMATCRKNRETSVFGGGYMHSHITH